MNIRTVDGNLVEDAKVLTNKSGKKYLSFRIANNDFEKGQKVVTYFNVASYNDYAIQKHETENHYSKGKLVVVVGKPEENMTQKGDKMYLNRSILAYNIQLGTFASTKSENNEQTRQNTGNGGECGKLAVIHEVGLGQDLAEDHIQHGTAGET